MHIDDIEKARAGIYKDTVENRQLGRVGQRYGSEKSVEEFRQNQVNLHGHFKSFIEELAKDLGALALVASPKDLDRVREKMVEDYGGDFTHIKDILRSTLVVDRDDLDKSLETISSKFNSKNKKNFRVKYFADFESEGYQGGNFVVEFEGYAVEIQVNTPVNIALKDNNFKNHPALKSTYEMLTEAGIETGIGHDYYKKWRSEKAPSLKSEYNDLMTNYYNNRLKFADSDKVLKSEVQVPMNIETAQVINDQDIAHLELNTIETDSSIGRVVQLNSQIQKAVGQKTKYGDVIVLNQKNEILLLNRSTQDETNAGQWTFPGGHVDKGESFQEGAARELQEETFIENKPLYFISYHETDKVIIAYYLCLVDQSPILDNNEHYNYKWVSKQELAQCDLKLVFDLKERLLDHLFDHAIALAETISAGTNLRQTEEQKNQVVATGGFLSNVFENTINTLRGIFSKVKNQEGVEKSELTEKEQAFEIIKKAFEQGLVDEDTFLQALQKSESEKIKQLEIQKSIDTLAKAFDNGQISEDLYLTALTKARQYQIGEISQSTGLKKVAPGKWVDPKTGKEAKPDDKKAGKSKSQEEAQSQKKTKTPDVSSMSDEELNTHAKQATTESLEAASNGGDEKLRVAAKKEIARRETEENFSEEDRTTAKKETVGTKTAKKEEEVVADLKELAKMGKEAKLKGEKAPNSNLCEVSIPGTNLFCEDNKGIKRESMPQLKGTPAPGTPAAKLQKKEGDSVDGEKQFQEALAKKGVKIEEKQVRADSLKATQSELVGVKVASMMVALEKDPEHPAITAPILVSRDGYVLDGHHRWAAIVASEMNTGEPSKMSVKQVDMDIEELVKFTNEFTEKFGISAKAADANNQSTEKKKKGSKVPFEKVKDKLKNWSKTQQDFYQSGALDKGSEERKTLGKFLIKKKDGLIKSIKHEVKEWKSASIGLKKALMFDGKDITDHEKKAMKTVAIHLGVTIAMMAATGGIGVLAKQGMAAVGKGIALHFLEHAGAIRIGHALMFAKSENEEDGEEFLKMFIEELANYIENGDISEEDWIKIGEQAKHDFELFEDSE